MGFILICVVLVVTGIILYNHDMDFEALGGIIGLVSSVALLVAVVMCISIQASTPSTLAGYAQDKLYVEANIRNDNLTGQERAEVMKKMLDDNLIIANTKTFRDSFMWGWFFQYSVGDLPPFDFTKLPPAKTSIDVGRE